MIGNIDAKKRRVGLELIDFKHGETQTNYCHGGNVVDYNNNNIQGCLSFEEAFLPNDWNNRHFGRVV